MFTLFYCFAVTVSLNAPFRGLDTPRMWGADVRASFRCAAAFLVLNIVPLQYGLVEVSTVAVTFGQMLAVLGLIQLPLVQHMEVFSCGKSGASYCSDL